jgi:hypothetical protein
MKQSILLFITLLMALPLAARQESVSSPDGRLTVAVSDQGGTPSYQISYDGVSFLAPSPLGLNTNIGNYTEGMQLSGITVSPVEDTYSVPTIKSSAVHYVANKGVFTFSKEGKPVMEIIFQLSNNDVAFRYQVLSINRDTKVCRVWEEATGYVFPDGTHAFLSAQMPPMAGFARTTPSYETTYDEYDTLGGNGQGFGFVFPALFRIGGNGWLLLSETGVNSNYCGGRLIGKADGSYQLAYPMEEEYNGNGTVAPGITVPGFTPWRTITVGNTLQPIAETTVAWDVVEPLYEPSVAYEGSKGSWSWIIKGDGSTVYPVQLQYIDFTAAMGWQTVLVDALWDTQIGRENMEKLAAYAKEKGVRLFVWYNSNGYWNDAPQGPRGIMNNIIARRKEMAWLRDLGVKGIKVDFFGSDKQVTMQHYEEILADANDFGLQCVFHGCTLPRGWERMYPNFASAEAVLASENLNFSQHRCDTEAQQASMHPFIRNTVAAMDFGGSTLNKVYNVNNDLSRRGSRRRTSDVFALATAVLFQSPVQHFAMSPENLTDAPAWAVDFMKDVPTLWDEVRFLDGYPGKYAILARRSGDKWYIAGINAQEEPVVADIPLPASGAVTLYTDDATLQGSVTQYAGSGKAPRKAPFKVNKDGSLRVTIPCNGGVVIMQ